MYVIQYKLTFFVSYSVSLIVAQNTSLTGEMHEHLKVSEV